MVNGWFILTIDLITSALIAGTILSALAGNFIEWRYKGIARLSEPVIDPQAPLASISRVMIAGPYLLINEAMIIRANHAGNWLLNAAVILFASLWCLSSGILCLEFLWQVTHYFNKAS